LIRGPGSAGGHRPVGDAGLGRTTGGRRWRPAPAGRCRAAAVPPARRSTCPCDAGGCAAAPGRCLRSSRTRRGRRQNRPGGCARVSPAGTPRSAAWPDLPRVPAPRGRPAATGKWRSNRWSVRRPCGLCPWGASAGRRVGVSRGRDISPDRAWVLPHDAGRGPGRLFRCRNRTGYGRYRCHRHWCGWVESPR
jgi:hypothetical protein